MSVYRTLYVRTLAAVQQRKLAVRDIACASALPEARIVSILEGEARDITLTELAGLCTALGMPPAALLRSA
ncbi:helix-turn-helix domain-containing protein [Novosphingobium sp. YJ-S2-02]|uniref:Helix-turn-helix domain-containing protein n=1 Tax=Novosphingobium aureum TaxID=2792964 RepID=A0A931MMC5_9SPHN|nr:helix-turn-helix domain-containing protein [Novosphingobium aureum]MBH0114997.1 helix-turn-helix domain-containing protein [Novosphingobium aureum]